jgi:hypothetical protein
MGIQDDPSSERGKNKAGSQHGENQVRGSGATWSQGTGIMWGSIRDAGAGGPGPEAKAVDSR